MTGSVPGRQLAGPLELGSVSPDYWGQWQQQQQWYPRWTVCITVWRITVLADRARGDRTLPQ